MALAVTVALVAPVTLALGQYRLRTPAAAAYDFVRRHVADLPERFELLLPEARGHRLVLSDFPLDLALAAGKQVVVRRVSGPGDLAGVPAEPGVPVVYYRGAFCWQLVPESRPEERDLAGPERPECHMVRDHLRLDPLAEETVDLPRSPPGAFEPHYYHRLQTERLTFGLYDVSER